jgi:hypothetical protein
MQTFTPPGGAFSVQLPQRWIATWEYPHDSLVPGKLMRARAPGGDAELIVAPLWTSQPWIIGDVGPATWENLADIERAGTRSGHVLREGRWGDFTGILKWKGSEDETRSWLLRAGETVLNVVYHCKPAVAGRDRRMIDDVVATLRCPGGGGNGESRAPGPASGEPGGPGGST